MIAWNWLDWTLLAIVGISIAAAAIKGFVQELIALAALIAALIVAALGYARAAVWFEDLVKDHTIALGAGFLALFVGTLILGAIAGALAKKLMKAAGLVMFDRFLGGVFGLVRGILLACILLMVMVTFSIKTQAVQDSLLAPFVVTGARVIVKVMPAEVRNDFQSGYEKYQQALIEKDQKASQK